MCIILPKYSNHINNRHDGKSVDYSVATFLPDFTEVSQNLSKSLQKLKGTLLTGIQCNDWLEHLALDEGVSKEREHNVLTLARMQTSKQRRYVKDLPHNTTTPVLTGRMVHSVKTSISDNLNCWKCVSSGYATHILMTANVVPVSTLIHSDIFTSLDTMRNHRWKLLDV